MCVCVSQKYGVRWDAGRAITVKVPDSTGLVQSLEKDHCRHDKLVRQIQSNISLSLSTHVTHSAHQLHWQVTFCGCCNDLHSAAGFEVNDEVQGTWKEAAVN